MPNAVVTIPQPVLTSGQFFKTRYRVMPSGPWSSYVNRTNAAFTLTGLSAVQYQLEVILVKADGTNCPPVYKTFTLIADYSCITFASSIMKQGSLYYININYTPPVGNPKCGWEIEYNQGTGPKIVKYTTLPASGNIKIPVANLASVLYIRADMCGKKKDCHSADLSPVPQSACDPIILTTAELFELAGKWYMKVNFTQSTPPSTALTVTYMQTGSATCPLDILTVPLLMLISSSTTFITFAINPKFCATDATLHYRASITDGCTKTWVIDADFYYG